MKLRNLSFLIACAFLFAAGLNSCSPYEEGPAISLRSKTERVANTWRVNYAVEADGDDKTSDYEEDRYVLDKDGNVTHTFDIAGTVFTATGTWAFTNDDENIRIQTSFDFLGFPVDSDETFEILKLKETEVWIRDIDDDQLEIHFIEV